MKTTQIFLIAAVSTALVMTSCGKSSTEANETEQTDSTEVAAGTSYSLNAANSSVQWTGEMLGMYSHEGTVGVKEGSVLISEGQVTGGNIVIDMSRINPTDDGYKDEPGRSRADLIGHLSSPDFFDVANFPQATFSLTKVNGSTGIGMLTLRGISHEETVENLRVTETDNAYLIAGDLTFDRKKYDIKFDMTVPDMVLSNDIKLSISLEAAK